MHILLVTLQLHIPHSQSLKDKRREIKSLKDKISARFNASVAEVGDLDTWQQATLAICMVSNDKVYLEKQLSQIELLLQDYAALETVSISREWL